MSDHIARSPVVDEVHITSLVVQSEPAEVRQVASILSDMPGAEVHRAEDSGKLVVLLETPSLHEVTDRVDAMRSVTGVITVTLVYHQIEDAALLDQPVAYSHSPA